MTCSTHSRIHTARVMLAVLLLTGTAGLPVHAATLDKPVSVTKPGQTVTDDFNIGNCTAPAVVDIAASAAKNDGDVTKVDTKNITATFSHPNEANGIWVHSDYPGTVKLADGLHITIESDAIDYNTSGIYLEGVDISRDPKSRDESVNANEEYKANGNKISDTKVEVGNGTSITVKAGIGTDKDRKDIMAVGLENHFGHMKVGNDVTLSVATGKFNQKSNTAYGFYQVFYGDTAIGDHLTSTAASVADGSTKKLVVSALASAHDHPYDKQIEALTQNQLTLGDDAHLKSTVQVTGETNQDQNIWQYGAFLSRTDFTIGKNMQIDAIQTGVKGASNDTIGGDICTIGLYNYGANGTIGAGTQNKVSIRDRAIGYVKGIYCEDSKVALGDRSRTSVQIENSNVFSDYGAHVKGKSSLAMGNDSTLSVSHQGGTTNTIRGVYVYPDSTFSAGDNLHLDMTYGAENQTGTVYGILNEGTVNLGKNARITITAPDERTGDTMAVYSYKKTGTSASQVSNVTLGDGAVLTVNSKAENKDKIINTVVKTDKEGQVTFDGGMTLMGSQNAIYSTGEGSSVSALGDGRKVILGDLEAANKGSIRLNLNTGDSLFRGKSTIDPATHGLMAVSAADTSSDSAFSVDTTSADTELTLANGARWDMTGSSQVTGLTLDNGGTVNMQYSPSYQRLDVNQYSGQNGIFQMKTDLASQTNGDKVYMNGAEKGSHGLVRVYDRSFLTGNKVTDTKHLLLITDNSKNATFSGQSIDEGGLWDVTPTIQNGSYVRNTMGVADARDTEWYLTKLTKSVNTDTKPLLGAVDYSYGLYRNSIDTLRRRMGDLRFLKNKRDTAGIWARTYGGNIDGPHYDSKYHTIQVGYDYAANDKSIYGFLGERGIASPHYDYGSSKDHSLAGAIYGTWFGDSGSYTDVVAKWGRDDSNLHTYGPYADNANFRTDSESLSVEYGRTLKLNGHGLFIEPQAQLVAGRLNDKDFTTGRGKKVHMDSYDSCIGRLGFVFGQRRPDASRPYDYYLKASVLHEFGGDRSFHLSAPDGETMDLSSHYGSTWYEAGFGGTYRANDSTYLYADAERSFGSNWHKKWQINIGINWQF